MKINLLKKRKRQGLETIVTIFKKDADISGQKGIGKVYKVYFSIRDFPGKNAISIATKYFNLLSRIVKECEKKYEIKKTAYIPEKLNKSA
jgi:hypothetical protein